MYEARVRALELANDREQVAEQIVARAEAFYAFLTDADNAKDQSDG